MNQNRKSLEDGNDLSMKMTERLNLTLSTKNTSGFNSNETLLLSLFKMFMAVF